MGIYSPTGHDPASTGSSPPAQGDPKQHTIAVANTEQTIALPAGLKGYFVANRGRTRRNHSDVIWIRISCAVVYTIYFGS